MIANTCDAHRTDKLHTAAKALSAAGVSLYMGELGVDSMARALLTGMLTHPLLSIDDSLVADALERLFLDSDSADDTLDIVRLDMLSTLKDENEYLREDALLDTGKLLERCAHILNRDYDGRYKLGFSLNRPFLAGGEETLLVTDSGFALGSAVKELHENGVGEWSLVLVNIHEGLNRRVTALQEQPF